MKTSKNSEFDSIVMLLQGGGALGAYQGGAYQALYEAKLEPDWVAGISIGAINAAIIAGNAPKDRVAKLREFWEGVTMDDLRYAPPVFKHLLMRNDSQHQSLDIASSIRTITAGIPGFFAPRPLSPLLAKGTLAATSFYDSKPLKETLNNLIDFDRINNRNIHFSAGAVNVTSGNFITFDNQKIKITAEHIMASGALPPGLPPVKIGTDYYWDGGLIFNTPLQWVMEENLQTDTLIFQLDLWSADGDFPKNMAEVYTRQKDIQYSSRTRANTDMFRQRHKLRHAVAELVDKLPPKLKNLPETKLLAERADRNSYNIVHLIYHNKSYEGGSKDFEFSRSSMEDHWRAGYDDTLKTLQHKEVLQKPKNEEGIGIYDFSREPGRKKKSAAIKPLVKFATK